MSDTRFDLVVATQKFPDRSSFGRGFYDHQRFACTRTGCLAFGCHQITSTKGGENGRLTSSLTSPNRRDEQKFRHSIDFLPRIGSQRVKFWLAPGESTEGAPRVKAARTVTGLALNYAPFTDTLGGFDASLRRLIGATSALHQAGRSPTPQLTWRTLINPADEELSSRLGEFKLPR